MPDGGRVAAEKSIAEWEALGSYQRLEHQKVFVVDRPCKSDHHPVVLLHGFPSSSHDFHRVVAELDDRRVITMDYLGFGLSDKPEAYSYSLFEQADIVELVLARSGVTNAHIVAHDMSTSIACELMARAERGMLSFTPRSLTLMNGSVYIDMAKLTPSQRLLRSRIGPLFSQVASYPVFRFQLGRIVSHLDESDYRAMWTLLIRSQGRARLPAIVTYLEERVRFRHRWHGALRRLRIPCSVLWGDQDPVAVPAIARRLAREIPSADLVLWPALGHYPCLEAPTRVADELRRRLD